MSIDEIISKAVSLTNEFKTGVNNSYETNEPPVPVDNFSKTEVSFETLPSSVIVEPTEPSVDTAIAVKQENSIENDNADIITDSDANDGTEPISPNDAVNDSAHSSVATVEDSVVFNTQETDAQWEAKVHKELTDNLINEQDFEPPTGFVNPIIYMHHYRIANPESYTLDALESTMHRINILRSRLLPNVPNIDWVDLEIAAQHVKKLSDEHLFSVYRWADAQMIDAFQDYDSHSFKKYEEVTFYNVDIWHKKLSAEVNRRAKSNPHDWYIVGDDPIAHHRDTGEYQFIYVSKPQAVCEASTVKPVNVAPVAQIAHFDNANQNYIRRLSPSM